MVTCAVGAETAVKASALDEDGDSRFPVRVLSHSNIRRLDRLPLGYLSELRHSRSVPQKVLH